MFQHEFPKVVGPTFRVNKEITSISYCPFYEGAKAAGSPCTWEDVIICNTIPEVSEAPYGCSNFAAWDTATKNSNLKGKLVHGVNMDFDSFGKNSFNGGSRSLITTGNLSITLKIPAKSSFWNGKSFAKAFFTNLEIGRSSR